MPTASYSRQGETGVLEWEMNTPARPLPDEGTFPLYVGLKVQHFRTREVYEVLNILITRQEGTVVKYGPPNTYTVYERPATEFWDEVEAEPGKWVPRFTAVNFLAR